MAKRPASSFRQSLFERAGVFFCALALIGCADSAAPLDTNTPAADPVRGQAVFVAQCAPCHASGDGVDLVVFGFSDTTIIRRALKHVDSVSAYNIVAYVRSLRAPLIPERTHLLQPGGVTVSSDVDFAIALFASDNFPADLTTAQMRAIDPRTVRAAVPTPIWSDEGSNLDWMPDEPLSAGILDDAGGAPRNALAAYRANPTHEALVSAVNALRAADHRVANAEAPCLLEPEDPVRVNYPRCFQLRRWIGSLVAQPNIRDGIQAVDPALSDVWWDVGNAARRSIKNGVSQIENAQKNWASWMYLSWTFDPSQHPSEYIGLGLNNLGLPRHATFTALRTEVARAPKTATPYSDVGVAITYAPNSWVYNVATFGFRHLLDRLNSGDVPDASLRAGARTAMNNAVANAQRRLADPQKTAIGQLGAQILAKLQ